MNLQRGMANNLVVIERMRRLKQRTPDFTKVIAGLHRKGRSLVAAALALCIDIPTKKGFSTEDTARLGGRDASSLARRRRRGRWGQRVESGQWIRGQSAGGMWSRAVEGCQRPACMASTSSGRSRGQHRSRRRSLRLGSGGCRCDGTRPLLINNMALTPTR